VICLLVLSILVVLFAAAGAIAHFVVAARTDSLSAPGVLAAVGVFLAGCAAGGLLWAAAWLIRGQYEATAAQLQVLSALNEGGAGRAQAPSASRGPMSPPVEPWPDVLSKLDEMNENLLLSAEQREAKRLRHQEGVVSGLVAEAERATASRAFTAAEQAIQRLREAAGEDPRADALEARLAEAREAAQAEDLTREKRRVEELMGASDYEKALATAEALLEKYPAFAEAIALVDRVRRERLASRTEKVRQLYGRIEQHAANREWRKAVRAAEAFLKAFPNTPQANEVIATMPTLQSNARLEEVRSCRDRIRSYIAQRRFTEAVELARHVVSHYPETAAAEELRSQLPRLEERAGPQQGQAG
jgi:tetratricopeptide (TPR) repeat protein